MGVQGSFFPTNNICFDLVLREKILSKFWLVMTEDCLLSFFHVTLKFIYMIVLYLKVDKTLSGGRLVF